MAELPSSATILELEARQDEVLKQLEVLEQQLQKALAQFAPVSPKPGVIAMPSAPAAMQPARKAA